MTDALIEVTLSKNLSLQHQGTYLSLPFDVPEHAEEVSVQLNVVGSGENVVDLGLEDPYGVRGWSGGARTSVFVREDRATPGYTVGPLAPGKWSVILNAYRICPDGCTVNVYIRIQKEANRWCKGDLHLHSHHSDGVYSISEVAAHVKEAGLEFMALTDHNTFSQNDSYPTVEDLVIIPAVELTTNRGHSNFYGVKKPFSDFRCQTVEDVQRVMREGEANGALISVNHPHCDICGWDWGLEHFAFQFVEIWNGVWGEANQRTLNWWQEQLCRGKRIIAIGGSDKHGPHESIRYGVPTTWILAKSHSPRGILEGMREGKVCVSAHPGELFVDINIDQTRMGGTHYADQQDETLDLCCTVSQFAEGLLKIISSEGIWKEVVLEARHSELHFEVDARKPFYRVEIWDKDQKRPSPLAISNPIFIKTRQSSLFE